MQPLEMILGFNKDEGLHVIIDLLMDPTNDTNFRMVHNKFYRYKCKFNYDYKKQYMQGSRKLDDPRPKDAL